MSTATNERVKTVPYFHHFFDLTYRQSAYDLSENKVFATFLTAILAAGLAWALFFVEKLVIGHTLPFALNYAFACAFLFYPVLYFIVKNTKLLTEKAMLYNFYMGKPVLLATNLDEPEQGSIIYKHIYSKTKGCEQLSLNPFNRQALIGGQR